MGYRAGDRGGRRVRALLVWAGAACGSLALGACESPDGTGNAASLFTEGGTEAGDARAREGAAGDAPSGDGALRDGPAGDGSTGDSAANRPDATLADGGSDAADATIDATTEGGGGIIGDGGAPVASLSTSPIAIGGVDCGTTQQKKLSIQNRGTAPLHVSATLTGTASACGAPTGASGGFSLDKCSLTIPAGGSDMFTVSLAIPGNSSAGAGYAAVLNLITDDPRNTSLSVPLSGMARGATLAPNNVGANVVRFPTTAVGTTSSPAPEFGLVNLGNAPATFSLGVPSPNDPAFGLPVADAGGTVMLAPSSAQEWILPATFNPQVPDGGNFTPDHQATVNITASGAICTANGTSLTSLTLLGTGTRGAVTGGLATTSSQPYAIPATCGGAAPSPVTFSLTNTSLAPVHVTSASITPMSASFSVTPPSGVVPPNGSLTFTVTAPPIGQTLTPVMATLTLTTDADPPIPPTYFVENPQGSALKFDPPTTTFDFGKVPVLQSQAKDLRVINYGAGTVPANVSLIATTRASAPDGGTVGGSGAPTAFAVLTPQFAVAPGATETNGVTFSPPATGVYQGQVTLSVDALTAQSLCAPLPTAPLLLQGTGGGPSVAPSSLTFRAPCDGMTLPTAQPIVVQNGGAQDLHWRTTAPTGPGAANFSVASVTDPSGDASPQPGIVHLLHPGELATLSVAVQPSGIMPSGATGDAGGAPALAALGAQLSVLTDVPSDPPHVIALQEVPLGDQLSVSLGTLPFGDVSVGANRSATIAISNFGNALPGTPSANVSLASSKPTVFSVAPSSVAPAPGGGASTTTVGFAPTSAQAYAETLTLSTTDLLCSPLPAPVRLTGNGTLGAPSLSVDTLDFGLVDCGTTAAPQTFKVTNDGTQAFRITGLTLASSTSPFAQPTPNATTDAPVTVAVGGSVTFTVSPKAIPGALPTPSDVLSAPAYSDTLTVATDVPNSNLVVHLKMQPRGAVVTLPNPLATIWPFGVTSFGSISTITSTLSNSGNADATATLVGVALPTVFSLQNSPTTLSAGVVTSLVSQFVPPSANGSWMDSGQVVVAAVHAFCSAPPAGWKALTPTTWASPATMMSGESNQNAPFSVTGSLGFEASECGDPPPHSQPVTLTNATNQVLPFTASLQTGTHYSLSVAGAGVDGGAGTVPPFGVVILTITPQPVVPGLGVQTGSGPYADSLTVAVGIGTPPVWKTQIVPISWTLDGAVLSLPQGSGPGGTTAAPFYIADTAGHTLPINNTGNEGASVTVSIPAGANFSIVPSSPMIAVPIGAGAQPQLVNSTGAPACPASGQTARANGTITLTTTGHVCQPLTDPATGRAATTLTLPVLACSGSL